MFAIVQTGGKQYNVTANDILKVEKLSGAVGDKVVVYKYKAKKNERKKQGHRQPWTEIKIVSIKM